MLDPDCVFIVFVHKFTGDVLLKPYATDPDDDMFLCVSLDDGAIDICRRADYPPARFVLNIPASQVVKTKFEITALTKSSRVIQNK
jgi:hypothetical protein